MRLLLIEDELTLCQMLHEILSESGYEIDTCHDGLNGLDYMLENIYDLVILDCMLPKMLGTDVLIQARKQNILTPILMLTALGQELNQINALDAGADDYLVKPVSTPVLLAHIRALLRRPAQIISTEELTKMDLILEITHRSLTGPLASCHLSIKECAILTVFLHNTNITLTRDMLINKIWGLDTDVTDGNLSNYIFLVRRRLEQVGSCLAIHTVHNTGYCLREKNV